MLLYPSKEERKQLLGAIPHKNETPQWIRFIRGLEKAKLSPYLHMVRENEMVLLYQSLNLKKIRGRERLRSFYEELRNLSSFDYGYARSRASFDEDPDYIMGTLLENHFFQVGGKDAGPLKKRWEKFMKSPGGALQTLFISCNGNDAPCCDWWTPGKNDVKATIKPDSLNEALGHIKRRLRRSDDISIAISMGSPVGRENLRQITDVCRAHFGKRSEDQRLIIMAIDSALEPGMLEAIKSPGLEIRITIEDSALWSGNIKASIDALKNKIEKLRNLTPEVVPSFIFTGRNHDAILQCAGVFRDSFGIISMRIQIFPGEDSGAAMAGRYLRLFHSLCDEGLIERNIGSRIWAFVTEKPIISKCGLSGGMVVVNSTGWRPGCPHIDGKVDNGIIPLLDDRCQNCIALGLCGGECRGIAGEKAGRDSFHCDFMKGLTGGLLGELLRTEYSAGSLTRGLYSRA